MDPPLPDEPKGWRELQAQAQKERDPQKLAKLINRMNQILAQTEKSKVTRKARKPKPPES
ncbi:MAG TPA: hypothetical protein VLV49_12645 [Terriglobales bacterium]|nr:hypothetical protein [Terriglobales bacterium]